jgi:glycosyltransferase involved in cell wall biosynthesis
MPTVGYLPYRANGCSVEAGWLIEHLGIDVRVLTGVASLNDPSDGLAPQEDLVPALRDLLTLPAVVAEGPGGFVWAALLRAHGFAGIVTVLPYLNPRRWHDVAAAAVYRRFADPRDRIFLGSTPSAALYRACGVAASVGEPYGIDDRLCKPRPAATRVRAQLDIPPGPLLLFAGRAQPDKDLYRLLRVGLKARLLFPDLQVVIASHVVDPGYLSAARGQLGADSGVHLVNDLSFDQLADLYHTADVFVTAATSHFETFGRAPAEALACGTPTVAPRYDGFAEVLAQPGGTLVEVMLDEAGRPVVAEDRLLRAVYDVLTSPPAARSQIAATATARFGRTTTIQLLRYLTGSANAPVPGTPEPPEPEHIEPVPPAPVTLPAEWRDPLTQIARREPQDALAWFWQGCDHHRLAVHDDAFAAQVRRLLCVPPLATSERVSVCR